MIMHVVKYTSHFSTDEPFSALITKMFTSKDNRGQVILS